MTATVATPTTRRIGRLLRTGVLAGVAASAVAIAIAAAARAADVPLEIDDKTIAPAAFALQTLLATAAGVLLAAVVRPGDHSSRSRSPRPRSRSSHP
jgi:hypothetical protein